MKIKNLLILLIGILLGSVSVYAITVKSNNVIFTPEDSEWNVSNVEDALNDLYENGNKGDIYYLGDSRSYDIKSLIESGKLPASIDYTKLTSDNFVVGIPNLISDKIGVCLGTVFYCSNSHITYDDITIEYNYLNGNLIISGGSYLFGTCLTDSSNNYCNDNSKTVNLLVHTYLVIGNIIKVN